MMTNAEQTSDAASPRKPWLRRRTVAIIGGIVAAFVLVAVGFVLLLASGGCC